jgi:hypothetical protein
MSEALGSIPQCHKITATTTQINEIQIRLEL